MTALADGIRPIRHEQVSPHDTHPLSASRLFFFNTPLRNEVISNNNKKGVEVCPLQEGWCFCPKNELEYCTVLPSMVVYD